MDGVEIQLRAAGWGVNNCSWRTVHRMSTATASNDNDAQKSYAQLWVLDPECNLILQTRRECNWLELSGLHTVFKVHTTAAAPAKWSAPDLAEGHD
jgi:hypothetical protein